MQACKDRLVILVYILFFYHRHIREIDWTTFLLEYACAYVDIKGTKTQQMVRMLTRRKKKSEQVELNKRSDDLQKKKQIFVWLEIELIELPRNEGA